MKYIITNKQKLYINDIIENNENWIRDNNENNIVKINYLNNELVGYSNKRYIFCDNNIQDKKIEKLELISGNHYKINDVEENNDIILYILDEKKLESKIFLVDINFSIAGNSTVSAEIIINKEEYNYFQLNFKKDDNKYILTIKDCPNTIYLNNDSITEDSIVLKFGDILFIDGTYLTLINNKLFIYNCNKDIIIKKLKEVVKDKYQYENYIEKNIKINNNKCKSFKRVPKIQRKIETKIFNIDSPSQVELKESMPLIYTMLPMFMMSMTSLVSIANIIDGVTLKEKTFEESIPSLIISGSMIIAMLAYPIITNVYSKHRESKREIKRIEEYKDYIYEQKRKILEEMEFQKSILLSNYYDTKHSVDIILNYNNELWERKKHFEDFLSISLGSGNVAPQIELKIPEEHFSIDKDKLRIQLLKLNEETKYIKDAPIIFDFQKNNISSFIGKDDENIYKYVDSFLIRLFAVCSPFDLKIAIFTNKENKKYWWKYSNLPYLWNNSNNLRFFASDKISYSKVVNYLDEEYRLRENNIENKDNLCKYILFIDDTTAIKNIPIINEMMKKNNNDFVIIFITNNIDNLPSECNNFIYLYKENGKYVSNVNKDYIEMNFIPDCIDFDFSDCILNLSNIDLDTFSNKYILPKKYGFLEMYNSKDIQGLNINSIWNSNKTKDSLAVPIGIDENGEIIDLDLHENAHGPHGLVAGMTGSGKSELLITYILSLAVNFSPLDVQFVLIDYKGGGLANTFYNSTIGMILPHVIGVITNIDNAFINRSLTSLNSEITRRQKLFAEISIKYNEGNLDIYKYKALSKIYNDIPPLSHLFIISDEFAELKTKNPEFIDKLISIARIGRSLGIHLILATQKPSGIVDSQIWSNSKFRICLKVQDKNDSNEIINIPDAAYINEVGRFYLQVGYNELFLKGQSAYSGVEYTDDSEDTTNESIDFINNYGESFFKVFTFEKKEKKNLGKEVNNIVKAIINYSKENNYNVKQLWTDIIPNKIYFEDLIVKYKFTKSNNIKAIIGEYDAPDSQKKDLATIELIGKGNTIIYGIIGSGKELVLETIIHSLINYYNSDEINLYLLDFGSETLTLFKNTPQVGDIVFINEKEKIVNLFKYILSVLNVRKKLLREYNGDIINYNKENNNKLSNIIIIINLLENLFDNYPTLEEEFTSILKECNRYGISFVTTTNGINSIRNKITQYFLQNIALELKDKYDYASIFNKKVNVIPIKYKGRGIILYDKPYEFQTCLICKENIDENDYIKALNKKLVNAGNKKVKRIPVLPEKVTFDIIKNKLINNKIIPIGIDVENLTILNYEFTTEKVNVITSMDNNFMYNMIHSLEKNIMSFKNNTLFMLNSNKKYDNINNLNIIDKDYYIFIKELKNYIKKSSLEITTYIIFIGIYEIYNNFSILEKKEFKNVLSELNKKDNFSVIIVDNYYDLKKLEFEEFYKGCIDNNKGIWIGNGIGDQMLFRVNRIPREYRDNINNNYGFVIESGNIRKIKLIDYYGDENDR